MAHHDHADALRANAMQGRLQRAVRKALNYKRRGSAGWIESSILGGKGAASDAQVQYCAKVMQVNFTKFPGFSGKFRFEQNCCEISANFLGTYCFKLSLWTFKRKFTLLESSLRTFQENLLWL